MHITKFFFRRQNHQWYNGVHRFEGKLTRIEFYDFKVQYNRQYDTNRYLGIFRSVQKKCLDTKKLKKKITTVGKSQHGMT